MPGVEFQSFFIFCDRRGEFVLLFQRLAQPEMCLGRTGKQCQCHLVFPDGLVELALDGQYIGQIAMGIGIIRFEGQPSQRMPVAGASGAKRPRHTVPCKTSLDPGIGKEIIPVIEIDEVIADRLTKDHKHRQDQQKANAANNPSVASTYGK